MDNSGVVRPTLNIYIGIDRYGKYNPGLLQNVYTR
jgi:hypothetical protein